MCTVCLRVCHDDILVYTVNAPCNPSYLSVSWLAGMLATSFVWWCCRASSTLSDLRRLSVLSQCMLLLWSIIFQDNHVSVTHFLCVFVLTFSHEFIKLWWWVLVWEDWKSRAFERDVSIYCEEVERCNRRHSMNFGCGINLLWCGCQQVVSVSTVGWQICENTKGCYCWC